MLRGGVTNDVFEMLITRATLSAAILVLFVSGCSANHHSIYRLRTVKTGDPVILTVDAKQRSIVSAYIPYNADGIIDTKGIRRFCSEPSPDVYSVIAQALSAGGSFGQNTNPASLEAAFNLAFSSAEQGSTIPKTQTINMLREVMFRTCERYLNGGYDELELSVQAIRDQRLMVSILAIEQLTGAVTPRPVAIGAAAGGSAGASGDAIVRLDDARKSKESADTAYTTATSNYDAKNGDGKICDAIKGKAEADLTNEQKPNFTPCSDLQKKKDEALAKRTATTASYTELSNLARSGGVTVNTAVSSSAEGGPNRVDAGAIAAVADSVVQIVAMNADSNDEFLFFCMKLFSPSSATNGFIKSLEMLDPSNEIRKTCINFILAGIEKAAQAQYEVSVLADRINDIQGGINDAFEKFWLKVAKADGISLDSAKFERLRDDLKLTPVGPDVALLRDLAAAKDKPAAQAIFLKLNSVIQSPLAN